MFFQKTADLILESHLAVMFFLVGNGTALPDRGWKRSLRNLRSRPATRNQPEQICL